MKATNRLCECGKTIAYVSQKGLRRTGGSGGHHMCSRCWKEERDRTRKVEDKGEVEECQTVG